MSKKTSHKLFINGMWRAGAQDEKLPIYSPASESEIGCVAVAAAADLNEALHSAQASFAKWARVPSEDRGAILVRASEFLKDRLDAAAAALTNEQGKTVAEAKGEYMRAVETLAWNGLNAKKLSAPFSIDAKRMIAPEPIGVVAAFTPWNYPAVLNARKLAAALAAGCPVILKAAEETPSAAVFIVEALEKAGMPAGVVSLVFGHPSQISEHLLGSSIVRLVSFTGSTAVGRHLARIAAENLQRCVLELGGHSPVVICEDADIAKAIPAIVDYKFECAGQSCNAPSRIIVARSIYRDVLAALTKSAEAIKVGDPSSAATQMGPMANARRIAAMERLIADAVSRGGTLETGGMRIDRPGFYWAPTILSNVPTDAEILREEPFGPVLTVEPFDTIEEAINKANASDYGLASYFFTQSLQLRECLIQGLSAGAVSVNHLKGVSADAPNAGVKDSGYGYEGGVEGFRAFQNLKLVNSVAGAAD